MNSLTGTDQLNQSGTLFIGSLAGVSIRLHFTFVILFIVLVFSSTGSPLEQGLYMLALFVSVLIHEAGHALASGCFRIRTQEIIMFPVGGVARLSRQPTNRQELWISLAGPAANFLVACSLLYWRVFHEGMGKTEVLLRNPEGDLLIKSILANILLTLLNLLPAYPMDGGKALRGFLSIFRPETEAARLASIIGRGIAVLLGVFGLLVGHYLLAFVAVFVYFGAVQENAVKMGQSLLDGVKVEEAMVTEFESLPHGATVGDAAKRLLATSQQDFPVVSGDQVVGLLSRNLLLGAMAESGPDTYVAGAMNRDFLRLRPDADLIDALPSIAAAGACGLVMDDDKLLGLLTSENLTEFLVLRRIDVKGRKQEEDQS